jgi:hypothetical protein
MRWLLALLALAGSAFADPMVDAVRNLPPIATLGAYGVPTRVILPAQAPPTATFTGGTCAGSFTTGGPTAGKLTISGACATTNTLALTNLPVAPTGWACGMYDITTKLALVAQTATTTTSVTFTFQGVSPGANFVSTGASDVLLYQCSAF